MRLEWIRSFIYATRYNSLNRAAEALYTTQPNVSKQVKKLEAFLGVQLLERTSAGVRLTREGAYFKLYAEKILETYDRYVMEKRAMDRALEDLDKEITLVVSPLLLQSYYSELKRTLADELAEFTFIFIEGYLAEISRLVEGKNQTYGLAYCLDGRELDRAKLNSVIIQSTLMATCAHKSLGQDQGQLEQIIGSTEYFGKYLNEDVGKASFFSSNIDLILKNLQFNPNSFTTLPLNIIDRSGIKNMKDIEFIYDSKAPKVNLNFIFKQPEKKGEEVLVTLLEDILRSIFNENKLA